MKKRNATENTARPPVIVIMGHIDHGKSTLLDYIRKTNVAEEETGGITQHLSAYEVKHTGEKGAERKITFLDTPGHEAFQAMRLRGAEIADIAVLVVSAEEGVKAQTLEAYASIKEAGLPLIVAINKIDKPNADVERAKQSLLENEIYLEGLGGDVPWVAISAKAGTGVSELLDVMLLLADLEELTGDPKKHAEGIVIEADRDSRKGVSATLIIRDGTLKRGMCIASGTSISPVRILEDFQGKTIREASFSSPVRVVGWNTLPEIGGIFRAYDSKKEAESSFQTTINKEAEGHSGRVSLLAEAEEENRTVIPILLKVDVVGSLDAIEHELHKFESEQAHVKIIQRGVGAISENDIKMAGGSEGTLVIGFHTNMDRAARELAERMTIEVRTFDIIYKISEWLTEVIEKRLPVKEKKEVVGRAKILKSFSRTKNKQVVGGRVESGSLGAKSPFRLLRQETEIGHGTIINIQQQKGDVREVSEGSEFGAMLDSQIEIAPGDFVEGVVIKKK